MKYTEIKAMSCRLTVVPAQTSAEDVLALNPDGVFLSNGPGDPEGEWELGKGFVTPSEQPYHVVAYDFGVKTNILRMLASRGCRLTVVPAQTSAEDVLALNPDGVFLSNGPGDPECELISSPSAPGSKRTTESITVSAGSSPPVST